MYKIFFSIALLALPVLAASQSTSSYAGEETREIKSLSPQQIDDYLNGRGMGYAKVAELNRFPGPKHVLELGEALGLSEVQLKQTSDLFENMKTQAVSLGQALVEKERALESAFADQSINEVRLQLILHEIGELQAQIRQTHLVAHIRQKALMSQRQLLRYDQLRGYTQGKESSHQHSE